MDNGLSQEILLLHQKAKVLSPTQYREWALSHLKKTLFIEVVSWDESHASDVGCIERASGRALADDSEVYYVQEVLPLSNRSHVIFFHLIGESGYILNDVIFILRSVIEAYDTSFLMYYSSIIGDISIAVFDDKGRLLHCDLSFKLLSGIDASQDISLSASKLTKLLKYGILSSENCFMKYSARGDNIHVVSANPHNEYTILLSTAELSIANYISKGFSNNEVSSVLKISVSTVNNHINNIFNKISVNNKVSMISKISCFI